MKRRTFLTLAASVLSWLGFSKAIPAAQTNTATKKLPFNIPEWLKPRIERLCGQKNIPTFDYGAVQFVHTRYSDVHCGAGTCPPNSSEGVGLRVVLWTEKRRYRIVIKTKYDYMGCVCSNNEPNEGETWTRGCDLADGKITEETWSNILNDICSMELFGTKYRNGKSYIKAVK